MNMVHAPHFFVEDGNLISPDSVNGTLKSITEVDGATIEVKADIEHYGGEVTMHQGQTNADGDIEQRKQTHAFFVGAIQNAPPLIFDIRIA